jgi:hypothetical protein
MDNARFNELLALSEDGDENAASDLWKEFNFIFGTDDPSKFEQTGEPSC